MALRTLAAVAALLTLTIHSQAARAEQPVKEWTMLVYVNGNNSLDYYTGADVNEMEQVGSTDQVNVVVQLASLKATTTKRLLVQKDNNPNKITSPVVQELPRVDMGDYKSLIDFIKWGVKNYPAKHYFVDVWNHGSGWHDAGGKFHKSFNTWNISYDDISGHSITTTQLGLAMEEGVKAIGHKVDIYASDACLMGMIEVAHQMKESVSYFVGSEDLEPGDGWPYNTLLEKWNALSAPAQAADVAKILPDVYTAAYPSQDVTMAAYDLGQIDSLTTALSNLRALMATSDDAKTSLSTAVSNAIKFYYSDYVDLGDFLNNLKSRVGGETALTIQAAQAELQKFVIANKANGQFQQAQGLAIWLPQTSRDYSQWQKDYSELSFDVTSQWHKLVEQSF